ncbi:MAG TPA: DUF167 domain-containing protein [Pirellulales bacterium]|jgi:hypothetical protein
MTVELREHPLGVILPVRAQPGARKNAVRGEHNGALRVSVTQAAEKGKANDAVIRVLCKTLNLRGSQVGLLAGATSQNKQFLMREITVAELAERITAALASAQGE